MLTPKRLVEGSQLTGSAVTYYTAPAKTKTILKKLTLTNTSAGAVTATVYLIPSGGTAGDANTLKKAVSIAAGATYDCAEAVNHVLEPGDFLQALASAGTAVTLMASGVECS